MNCPPDFFWLSVGALLCALGAAALLGAMCWVLAAALGRPK